MLFLQYVAFCFSRSEQEAICKISSYAFFIQFLLISATQTPRECSYGGDQVTASLLTFMFFFLETKITKMSHELSACFSWKFSTIKAEAIFVQEVAGGCSSCSMLSFGKVLFNMFEIGRSEFYFVLFSLYFLC